MKINFVLEGPSILNLQDRRIFMKNAIK